MGAVFAQGGAHCARSFFGGAALRLNYLLKVHVAVVDEVLLLHSRPCRHRTPPTAHFSRGAARRRVRCLIGACVNPKSLRGSSDHNLFFAES